MRMLVTGGAGFMGGHFVRHTRLSHADVELVVLDALVTSDGSGVPAEVRLVRGDVRDAEVVDRLVRDVDVVVHFAAESHVDTSLSTPVPFVHTNVVGTATVLEAVRRHDVRLHHVSTDEVFGSLELDSAQRFTEASCYRPSSPYAASKAGGDLLVQAWTRSFGVSATVTNCSNAYGSHQHVEKFVPRQITNLLCSVRPRLYGTGHNVRDWIHVDDHSAAVWTVLERGTPGASYVVGADGEHSNRQVVHHLLAIAGQPPDAYDLVADRPGHDDRYAVDSTRSGPSAGRPAVPACARGSRRRTPGTARTRAGGGRTRPRPSAGTPPSAAEPRRRAVRPAVPPLDSSPACCRIRRAVPPQPCSGGPVLPHPRADGRAAGGGDDRDDAGVAVEAAGAAAGVLLALRPRGGDDLRARGDREAQRVIAEVLRSRRPGDAVLSEEAPDDPARLTADRVWIVDPLDGTREYGEPGRTDWAVHVALWQRGELTAGAVALPARDLVLRSDDPPVLAGPPAGRPRLAVSRTRATETVRALARVLDAELVPLGSAGVKAMSVALGDVDAYVHTGGQYEWDSAAPVAVARAAGLHTSRTSGDPLVYNRPDPLLPDLVVCRPELTGDVLAGLARLGTEVS